jgi:hypothetical protein
MKGDNGMSDEIVKAKIRRALLSGPDVITREATVAEMDAHGKMTVLRPGTNRWVCIPGNENIIGQADMCADPMGMRWMMDVMATAQTVEYRTRTDIHAQRRSTA